MNRKALLAIIVVVAVITSGIAIFVISAPAPVPETFAFGLTWPTDSESVVVKVYAFNASALTISPTISALSLLSVSDSVLAATNLSEPFATYQFERSQGQGTQAVTVDWGSIKSNLRVKDAEMLWDPILNIWYFPGYHANYTAAEIETFLGTVHTNGNYSFTKLASFHFPYPFGLRPVQQWSKVDSNHWMEFHEDGQADIFIITSHESVLGTMGTIVTRINRPGQTGTFQVFFADPGESQEWFWFRHADSGDWSYLTGITFDQ